MNGHALIALLALGVTAAYVLACWLDPMVTCRWCGGTGRRYSFMSTAFGGRAKFHRCWWCKANRVHPRLGARIMSNLGRNRR